MCLCPYHITTVSTIEGSLRVDANVSVRPAGDPRLGVRSEVKNISSVRGVARAVQFEVSRQVALRRAGRRVVNETRSYDPERAVTVAMRDKEVVQVNRLDLQSDLLSGGPFA